MRVLRTRRLRLVPVTTFNAEVLWNVLQEPDLRTFQDLPDTSKAHFMRIVAQRPEHLVAGSGGRYEWLIYYDLPEEGTPLGWVSLRLAERVPPAGEIGYSVVAAERRRGIASEAVAALAHEAFERAGVHELRAYCVPENEASRAVLHRCGFIDEGLTTHGATVNGRPVDVIGHVLARERFERLNRRRSATGS